MANILVIDDEYLVRYTLARVLRRQGHTVATAADGARGVAAFRDSAPDLVLADMVMPEPEGVVAIRRLRRERPDAKIIAIAHDSLIDEPDALAMARRLGADDVIFRPFDTDELRRHLEGVLARDGAATA